MILKFPHITEDRISYEEIGFEINTLEKYQGRRTDHELKGDKFFCKVKIVGGGTIYCGILIKICDGEFSIVREIKPGSDPYDGYVKSLRTYLSNNFEGKCSDEFLNLFKSASKINKFNL
jgi:hypothetical protein